MQYNNLLMLPEILAATADNLQLVSGGPNNGGEVVF